MNKKILYFHARNGSDAVRKNGYVIDDQNMLQHTYAVERTGDNELCIGYSLVHEKDHFCRKTGRKFSTDRLNIIKQIPNTSFHKRSGLFFPQSICYTLNDVIDKYIQTINKKAESLGEPLISYPITIKTFINDGPRKIPVSETIDE